MINDHPLFRSGSLIVTRSFVRTSRETIYLNQIEKVGVSRPLLFVLAPTSTMLLAVWFVFRADLYSSEAATLLGIAAIAGALAITVGEMQLKSLTLRDETMIAPIWRLRGARPVIEAIIHDNKVRALGTQQPTDLPPEIQSTPLNSI